MLRRSVRRNAVCGAIFLLVRNWVIACQDRLGTQARGELNNLGCFFCRDFATHPCAPASCPISSGKKTRLFAPLIPKMIILPGQARDKHRRSTQKQTVFSQARKASTISRRCRSMRRSSMASASASRRKCVTNRQADKQTGRCRSGGSRGAVLLKFMIMCNYIHICNYLVRMPGQGVAQGAPK
jgi:hypothetical protein